MINELTPSWLLEHKKDINRLRETFRKYYRKQGRSFPWRTGINAFQTLLTECLLQRTRADLVARIWPDFIARFGTVQKLSEASEEELAEAIRPLGLAWRARFLYRLAVELRSRFDSEVPSNWKELISLPGLGPYAASAIRSFGYGIREGIVDSNTVRIFSRYFNIHIKGDKAPLRFWHPLSRAVAASPNHREINYGMLDFAAEICTNKNPLHNECNLRNYCLYYQLKLSSF